MQPRLVAGLLVNAAMITVWAGVTWWMMKADSFPRLVHGSFQVSGRGMRVAWALLLFYALAVGGPSVSRTERSAIPPSLAQNRPSAGYPADFGRNADNFDGEMSSGGGWEIRFGSYARADYAWELANGETVSYAMTEFRLPLYFPAALLLFWLTVRQRPAAGVPPEELVFP